MLRFTQVLKQPESDDAALALGTLTLAFDQRVKSRLKVTLDNGQDAGLFLPRGLILRQDDVLLAETGESVEVMAATESVSTVKVNDPLLLARACYHLGNRHVPLQITNDFIRYQHDHVLDAMLQGLGLEVIAELAAFQPEAGAYGESASGHQHTHGHHTHTHE